MKKRDKVIRDTSAGPGLLIAEGQQHQFQLEGVWRSEEAPRVGMVVDVELGERGDVVGITALPESQLAREQAEVAMAAAKERGAALASTGIYGLLAVVAIAGPFVHHFWKDKRATLGALLPPVFMLLIGYTVLHKLDGVMGGGLGGGSMGEIANQVSDAAWKAISIGSGVYISMIASLYFAFTGSVKFLASRATGSSGSSGYSKPQKMTA